MCKAAPSLAIFALALPLLAAAPAQAQVPRTWVSGTGDDNSPTCSRTAPCRTFQVAQDRTAPGGEINCLDPGEFSSENPFFPGNFAGMSITKSITISCEAGTAGVRVQGDGQVGVFVLAAPTDVVTLRGLDIQGTGGKTTGIFIFSAMAVHVEKSTIRSLGEGIDVTGSSTTFLFIEDTVISDNSGGVLIDGSEGGFKVASLKNVMITGSTFDGLLVRGSNVYVNVTKSIIAGNAGSAVNVAASSSTVNIERSMIANNAVGLNASASGSIIRASLNYLLNNTNNLSRGIGAQIASDNLNRASVSGPVFPNASFIVE